MKRTDSGLFVAHNFNFLRRHGRAKGTEKVVTDPVTGERMRVWRDDSRTVRQIEHNDTLDAIVTPQPVRLAFTARTPKARSEVLARVQAIAARISQPKVGNR